MDNLRYFETNLSSIERGFNKLGSIPGVAVFSGAFRATLGKVQLVAAVAFVGFSLIIAACSKGAEADKWVNRAQIGTNHIIHGCANVVRGIFELALGVTLVGSLIPLTIQLVSERGFAPCFEYQNAI